MKKSEFWGSKKRSFFIKKGSDFVFLGGGLKTWSLKVDRIYGEIFSEVSTLVGSFFVFLGSFFRLFWPLFWVKIIKFVTFFTFSRLFWPPLNSRDFHDPPLMTKHRFPNSPSDQRETEKTDPQKWPRFGMKKRVKSEWESWGWKEWDFLSGMLRFLKWNVKIS